MCERESDALDGHQLSLTLSPEQEEDVLGAKTEFVLDCGGVAPIHVAGHLLSDKVLQHGTLARRLTTDHGDLRQVELHVNAQ